MMVTSSAKKGDQNLGFVRKGIGRRCKKASNSEREK